MRNLPAILFMILVLYACKQSDQYSVDNIYPIPNYQSPPSESELETNLKVQEPLLQPYVDEFNGHASDFGTELLHKGIYYKFADLSSLPGKILGKCEAYKNDNIVLIDRTFWLGANVWDKRSVIFHELGHCVLGRGHRTFFFQGPYVFYDGGYKPSWPAVSKYLADGVTPNPNHRGDWPISLMHRSIVRQARFQAEETYYLTELFTEDGAEFVDNSFADSYLRDEDCTAHLEIDGNIHF